MYFEQKISISDYVFSEVYWLNFIVTEIQRDQKKVAFSKFHLKTLIKIVLHGSFAQKYITQMSFGSAA